MRYIIIPILILSFCASFVYAQDATTKAYPGYQRDKPEATLYYNIFVKRVIDGNTLELDNGEVVSLIGVDTPKIDTKEGKKAREFTKSLIEDKNVQVVLLKEKRLRLEFDVQKKDDQGKLLAYVFIDSGYDWHMTGLDFSSTFPDKYFGTYGDEWTLFVNASIIKAGYAFPSAIPPNVKYADLFRELYQEARRNKKGLWKESNQVITRDIAMVIAKNKLKEETFVDNIDVKRAFVRFRDKENDYWVDFAWKDADEITGQMLFERGYQVVIDADTGEIKDCGAYKR
ncbi:MAG: thermonuclease family protein [Candidatus Omnitrophota bacterium]